MKFLSLSLLLFSWVAEATPRLDPNKATVCAMTLNSDEERHLFEAEVKKHPNDYNPIVELTDFGGRDWYEKACKSGIKCDQLLISGHFSSGFTGTHNGTKRSLPLNNMEMQGCTNTCEGIMDHPYEVFLMGCNTLSTKKLDSRTPASYAEHLVHDGVSRPTAELIAEGRYGTMGDDNISRVKRSFRGKKKQLYGFTSIGPSGKTVDPMLRRYFQRTSLLESLETARAARSMNHVIEANDILASELSATAFTQCNAGADTEKDRRICKLLHPSISLNDKLDVMVDAMAQSDWVKYVPTINKFISGIDRSKMSHAQVVAMEDAFNQISESDQLRRQVRNLHDQTSFAAVKAEWKKFGDYFGFFGSASGSRTPARRESLIGDDFLKDVPKEKPASRIGDDFLGDPLAPRP